MHSPFLKSILLLVLLLESSVESRSWHQRPLGPPSLSRAQSSYLTVRGGDESSIPKVPEDVNTVPASRISPDVSRGGSTKAEKYPGGVIVFKPTGGSSSATAAPQTTDENAVTTSDSVIATHDNAVTTSDSVITTHDNAVTTSDSVMNTIENDLVPNTKSVKKEKKCKKIAKRLKNRNATNIRRKVLHACFGFFFAGLNHFIPKAKFVPAMTTLTSFTLIMELVRYRKGFDWINEVLHSILGSSLRKHEMDGKFTGSFYYFLGVTVTSAVCPTSCATLGICQLAIADPTASYFGRRTRHIYWSRIENGLGGFGRNKGILGFLGGAIACVPMNYRLLSLAKFGHPVSRANLLTASFALGVAGAFADLAVPTPTLTLPKRVRGVRVPPFHVDDNFVVPVFAGYACKKIFEALKWSPDLELAESLLF